MLEFALQTLGNWTERNCPGQLLLASYYALCDHFRVIRAGTQVQEPLEVVNGRGVVLLVFLVEQSGLEVGGGRAGVYGNGFLEALDRAGIIEGVDAALAFQKVRLLFLIQLRMRRRQAAPHRKREKEHHCATTQARRKCHGPRLGYCQATFKHLLGSH